MHRRAGRGEPTPARGDSTQAPNLQREQCRLLNYVLRLYSCLRRLSQRSGASRLNDLLFEVAAVATRSSGLFVRDQETTCASHFQPCWQCSRHKEGHEVAVVTLFMLCEKTWLRRERLHNPFHPLPPLARCGS